MQLTADSNVTRDELAAQLKERGFPITSKTLANLATQGKGPPYRLFSRRTLYRWADALAWAEGRLTQPRHSASEHNMQKAA